MFNIVHVHVHVYYAYTVHVLDFSCTMYMYVESTVALGFHLGDGGAWELIRHILNYSTIDNKKLLHNKTKILSKRQSYPFCSSLAIPFSDKPELFASIFFLVIFATGGKNAKLSIYSI